MNTNSGSSRNTKLKILEAVLNIVRESGIQSLSSSKIVRVAGVSKGGFFHYFPQMEDLYLYLLDSIMLEMEQSFRSASFGSVQEFISIATEYTIQSAEDAPELSSCLFYFLAQCQHKPSYKSRLEAMLQSAFSRWVTLLNDALPHSLSQTQKENIVRILDMYFCGLSFHFLILGEPEKQRQISSQFAAMVQHQIMKVE